MPGTEILKAENIEKIRNCFYKSHMAWTRPQLSEETGLSMAGVLNILKILMNRNEIQHAGNAPSTGGRRSKQYVLNPDYTHIGILRLKHEKHEYSLSFYDLNLHGETIRKEVKEVTGKDRTEILHACRGVIMSDKNIRTAVISVPSMVRDDGILDYCDFPSLVHVNLKQELQKMVKASVQVVNDVNLSAVGYSRQHPECENLAVLYQPDQDPAGSGIIIHHELYTGRNGAAGEIGQFGKKEQMRLLKDNPEELIRRQISVLAAVFAPDRIAWYCPLVSGKISEEKTVVERTEKLDELIRKGAEELGRKEILKEAVG